MESLVGSEGQPTQKLAGLELSSEFTIRQVAGRRRADDRLAVLRDWNTGSLALGDTFGPNLGGFR